jgi:hypothetical protein
MKKILKIFGTFIVVIIGLSFIANNLIRVSDGSGDSIGIIENLIFGKPLSKMLLPPWSENFKRWDSSSKASKVIGDLLQKYGVQRLFSDPGLKKQKEMAKELSATAYQNASLVSKEYLKQSNEELPAIYFKHFVPAMKHWQNGFLNNSEEDIQNGIIEYNNFLLRMQSKDRNNFKPLQ